MGAASVGTSSTPIRRKETMQDVSTIQKYFPITQWMKIVTTHTALTDFISGITIGLIILPQSMSYARMIGIEPEHGLYSSLMCVIAYLIFGTSREAALGPTAVLALVMAAALQGCKEDECMTIVTLSTFFAGLFQFILGILQLGFVVTFISHAAISGFCSGAALVVIVQQSTSIFGTTYKASGIIWRDLYNILKNIGSYDLPFNANFILGISCIISIILLKEAKKLSSSRGMSLFVASRNVIVLAAATIISYIFASTSGKSGAEGIPFKVVGAIPAGLPNFSIPTNISMDMVTASLQPAILVSLIGFVEAYAIITSFPYSGEGTRVDASQELISFGVANMICSLFQGFAVTASFARSAVNSATGVKTQLHNLYAGILIGVSLCFFTGILFYVPNAALAAVIVVGISSIIDIETIRSYVKLGWRASKYDAIVTATSFIGTLIVGVENAIILAIAVHSIIMLYRLSRPKISSELIDTYSYYTQQNSTKNDGSQQEMQPLRALRISVEGNMYYISAARVESSVKNISRLAAIESPLFKKDTNSLGDDATEIIRSTRTYSGEIDESTRNNLRSRVQTSERFNGSQNGIAEAPSMELDLEQLSISPTLLRLMLKLCHDAPKLFSTVANEEGGITEEVLAEYDSSRTRSDGGNIQNSLPDGGNRVLFSSAYGDDQRVEINSALTSHNFGPMVGVFFDLSKVNSIDSTGLETLVSACRHVILNPVVLCNRSVPFPITSIYLVGASSKIIGIMEESNILKTMPLGFSSKSNERKIVDTVAEAMQGLAQDTLDLEQRLLEALSFGQKVLPTPEQEAASEATLNNDATTSSDDINTSLLQSSPSELVDLSTCKDNLPRVKLSVVELLKQIHSNQKFWIPK